MNAFQGAGARAYQSAGAHGQVAAADPHGLVLLLLDGAIERLALAQGQIKRGEIAQKGETLSRTLAIIDTLNANLDTASGGELAENLRGLYDYMSRRLLEANLRSDVAALGEVAGLLKEIRAGWQAISPAAQAR